MLFPLSLMSLSVSLVIVVISCFFMAKFRHIYDRIKIPLAIFTVIAGLILYTIGYIPTDSNEPLEVFLQLFLPYSVPAEFLLWKAIFLI